MGHLIDIIIPTWNNPAMLMQCLNSIAIGTYYGKHLFQIHVVNNGYKESCDFIKTNPDIVLHNPGENLRWEGGLKYALKRTSAPFVLFANDDIRFIEGHKDALWRMLALFNDPKVAAVGPCSNFVMGPQNIFADIHHKIISVRFLIGFCLLIRREDLSKAGGVDDALPGGDDIDLSIRLRDLGQRLLCRRDVFVFHHGAVTGSRVHAQYWNSASMQNQTNNALIRKHGMRKFWDTMVDGWAHVQQYAIGNYADTDIEGELCVKYVKGNSVLELGCGAQKTIPTAQGVDLFKQGELIPLINRVSMADYVADVSKEMPVEDGSQDTILARHILEHCQDPLATLALWNKALKVGGRLVIAVPNHNLGNTIIMNPEHVNSFTPKSLSNLMAVSGFKEVIMHEKVNGISFVAAFEKVECHSDKIALPVDNVLPFRKEHLFAEVG